MQTETLYIDTSQAPVSDVGGAMVQFLASHVPVQETTLDVILGALPPGVFVPLHSHTCPEWFFVLEGEMEAFMGDEKGGAWKAVRPGELAVIPAGVRHAWRNRSSSTAKVLSFGGTMIFAVMRKIAVPANQANAAAAPSAEFLEELNRVAASTGNWIATPQENAAIGLHLQPS